MSSNQGWIKLHRALLDWQWFSDANTSHVLMYCLMKANHKDKQYRDTLVKRGTFLTGRDMISLETGCSVREVRTALKRLESANVLTSKTSRQGTVIEVINYDRYQASDQQNDQQATNERPTNDQRATTNKNDKKEKNEKNTLSDDAPPAEDGELVLIEEEVETKIDTEKDFLRDLWESAPAIARSRSSKKDVLDAWSKITKKNRPSHKIVLESYQGWLLCVEWTRDGGQAIPGLHRWIKKEQWESTPEPAPSHNQNSPSLPSSPTYTRACG